MESDHLGHTPLCVAPSLAGGTSLGCRSCGALRRYAAADVIIPQARDQCCDACNEHLVIAPCHPIFRRQAISSPMDDVVPRVVEAAAVPDSMPRVSRTRRCRRCLTDDQMLGSMRLRCTSARVASAATRWPSGIATALPVVGPDGHQASPQRSQWLDPMAIAYRHSARSGRMARRSHHTTTPPLTPHRDAAAHITPPQLL